MRELKKDVWPHKITVMVVEDPDINLIEPWLSDQFGRWKNRWNVVYRHDRTDFYFKNSADATLFALKWT